MIGVITPPEGFLVFADHRYQSRQLRICSARKHVLGDSLSRYSEVRRVTGLEPRIWLGYSLFAFCFQQKRRV